MATLAKREGKTPSYEIQFYLSGQSSKRTTIYLGGRYNEQTATDMLRIVETLVYYRDNSIQMIDKRTLAWLESATQEIRDKLGRAGLIEVPQSHTVKELWDSFLKQKTGIKESTELAYEGAKRIFFEFFKEVELAEKLTKEKMQQWKNSLLARFSEATTAGTLTKAKAVFNWAVQAGWIDESPLTGVGRGSFVNKSRDQFITMEEYYKLLDACPCPDWRVIVSLARIGGVRCPSEITHLTWNDVDWDKGRFYVRSPKTEHHKGKEGRWVPLFPELRKELDTLYFMPDNEGREFVINRYRDSRQNLGTMLAKIVKRAGLPKILRPFDNMRASRSNEVYSEFGSHKESEWIGHSARVRADHYGMITDADYTKATNWNSTHEPATAKGKGRIGTEKSRLEACFADGKTPAIFPAVRSGKGPQGVAKENCDTKEKGP